MVDKFIKWIGSFFSLVLHTLIFISCFVYGFISGHWDSVLLILTTLVSLEAIYLSIFIQMSINRNTVSLEAVEKDIDEIQVDVDEIQKDVDDIAEDVDEIQKDVDDIAEDVVELQEDDKEVESQEEHDRRLMGDIRDSMAKIMTDIELLKRGK